MKIEKPANKTFWVARNADGSVLHAGKTDSNQTITITDLDINQ